MTWRIFKNAFWIQMFSSYKEACHGSVWSNGLFHVCVCCVGKDVAYVECVLYIVYICTRELVSCSQMRSTGYAVISNPFLQKLDWV